MFVEDEKKAIEVLEEAKEHLDAALKAIRCGHDVDFNADERADAAVEEALDALSDSFPHVVANAGWPIMRKHWAAVIARQYSIPADTADVKDEADLRKAVSHAIHAKVLAPTSVVALEQKLRMILTLRLNFPERLG